jgi:hypothetical protein
MTRTGKSVFQQVEGRLKYSKDSSPLETRDCGPANRSDV